MLYYLAATALGAGWMLVLSVPNMTRKFIPLSPRWNVASLIIGSIVIAYVFKSWISRRGGLGAQVGRAIVITYVGCVVYLTLVSLFFEAESLRFGVTESFRDWLPRYFWGTISAVCAFYVVVPYGVFCQLVLNRISRMNALAN
jgi:glycopeptide antibiotics resistance protein